MFHSFTILTIQLFFSSTHGIMAHNSSLVRPDWVMLRWGLNGAIRVNLVGVLRGVADREILSFTVKL